MSKKSKRKIKLPKAPPYIPVDPKLMGHVGALKALVVCHNLLDEGLFPRGHFPAIQASQQFLMNLHKQVMDEAIVHPDAPRIPEFQELLVKK